MNYNSWCRDLDVWNTAVHSVRLERRTEFDYFAKSKIQWDSIK